MPDPNETTDLMRLKKYYGAEVKYTKFGKVPVPTPLDRATAVEFIEQQAKPDLDPNGTQKLERLAVFYRLSECRQQFLDMLNNRESDAQDCSRSSLAIGAVSFIGSAADQADARKYYNTLFRRTSAERDHQVMLATCDALGPQEGTKTLSEWLQKGVDKLAQEAKEEENRGDAGRASAARAKTANLREFLRFQVPEVDKANKVREKVDQAPSTDAKIQRLVNLYLDEGADAMPLLTDWAGIQLLYLAMDEPAQRSTICEVLMKLAQRFAGMKVKDKDEQRYIDAKRARSLRAAEYFGESVGADDNEWLKKLEDTGDDLIALRPDWEYPDLLHPEEPEEEEGEDEKGEESDDEDEEEDEDDNPEIGDDED